MEVRERRWNGSVSPSHPKPRNTKVQNLLDYDHKVSLAIIGNI